MSTNQQTPKSAAQERVQAVKDAIAKLPYSEKAECDYVRQQLAYMRATLGSSAKLAIVLASLEIAAEEGQ